MAPSLAAILGALTLVLSLAISHVHATCARGLGWATNNQYGSNIGHKPMITWYHRQYSFRLYFQRNSFTELSSFADWQDGVVPEINVEFVPMFWGPSKWSQWSSCLSEMNKKTPQHLLSFNEPDVAGQANMDPNYAAELFMQQIYPWSKKGVQIGSPAVVWNLDWVNTFLNAIKQKGGHVDFICLHWCVVRVSSCPTILNYDASRYGSWKDLAGFQKYVQTAHSRFGKNIWIPELGVTSASNPSQSQVKAFMMNAFNWMDSQSYVSRAAWFGKSTPRPYLLPVIITSCFTGAWESNHPPDSFSSHYNAMLAPGGSLNDMGQWLVFILGFSHIVR